MEVALAATVLALALIGMIGAVESGTQMLDVSRKQTLAAQILRGEIEQLHLQSWQAIAGEPPTNATSSSFYSTTQVGYSGAAQMLSTVPPGNGYAPSTTLTAANDPSYATFVANYPQVANIFTLTRTVACVQPVQANPNPSSGYSSTPFLLQVTFTITWKGVTGRLYSRTSTTYVGYNGLYQEFQRS